MASVTDLLVFLALTCVLGGLAAWTTGRAVARLWAPVWQLAVYAALLSGAVRFLHFALSAEPLFSFTGYAASLAVLAAVAAVSYRTTRAGQMARQYPWLFERTGPLSWRPRA